MQNPFLNNSGFINPYLIFIDDSDGNKASCLDIREVAFFTADGSVSLTLHLRGNPKSITLTFADSELRDGYTELLFNSMRRMPNNEMEAKRFARGKDA